MLEKPSEYNEVSARQNEETVYAEDINKIISNIEILKGGEAYESPISNIKELKERLDNLEKGSGSGGNIDNVSADKVSFNNDKAMLPFFKGYDFPPVKNELKEKYIITLIDVDDINQNNHIDDAEGFILNIIKENGVYKLKGNITLKDRQHIFIIKSIDDGEYTERDLGYNLAVIKKFITEDYYFTADNINIHLKAGLAFVMPAVVIESDIESNEESAVNIDIELLNIKKYDIYSVFSNNIETYLKYINDNGKVYLNIDADNIRNDASVLFSDKYIENYFDIFTLENDSNYITDSKGNEYYILKVNQDFADFNQGLLNTDCTYYQLKLKEHQNSINERININLEAVKNNTVSIIEDDKNVQNALDILSERNYYELNKLKKTASIKIGDEKKAVYTLYTYSRFYMTEGLLFTAFISKTIGNIILLNLENINIQNEYQSMIYDFNALGLKNIKMHYTLSNKVYAFCIQFMGESEEEKNALKEVQQSINNDNVMFFNKITFIADDGFDNYDIMTDDVIEYIKLLEKQLQAG